MEKMKDNPRESEHAIDGLFMNRWSPRAMAGKIGKEELMSLFEAARWAPSSYNNQSWRFIYAIKETKHWESFFGLMGDFNKSWAKDAGALVLILSKKIFDHNGMPTRTHGFDAGAAWQNMALQGTLMGIATHAMEGFNYEDAARIAGVPDGYEIHALVAVGRHGKKEQLPEGLREREAPSDRKKVQEFAFEGAFKK